MSNPLRSGLFTISLIFCLAGISTYKRHINEKIVDQETAQAAEEADHRAELADIGDWEELVRILWSDAESDESREDPVRRALIYNELAEICSRHAPDLDGARKAEARLQEALLESAGLSWQTREPYLEIPTVFKHGRLFISTHEDYIRATRHLSRQDIEEAVRSRQELSHRPVVIPGHEPLDEAARASALEKKRVFEAALRKDSDPKTENRYLAGMAYMQLRLGEPGGIQTFNRFLDSARAFDLSESYGGSFIEPDVRYLAYISENQYARMLGAAGRVLEGSNPAQAMGYYQRLAKHMEETRLTTTSEEIRINYFRGLDLLYERLVELAISQNNATLALVFAEKAKSRSLVDLLSGSGSALLRQQAIEARRQAYADVVVSSDGLRSVNPTRGLELAPAGPTDAYTEMAGLRYRDLDADDFQPTGEELLVEYMVLSDTLVRWSLYHDQIVMETSPVPESHIQQLTMKVRATIQAGGDGGEALEELSHLLLDGLPTTNGLMTFVPDGSLHAVPFSALLLAPEQPLGLKRVYTTSPSLSVRGHLARLPTLDPRRNPVVVADPPIPIAGFPRLPGARAEGREVAALLGTASLEGETATEALVRTRARDASVLHLATHGFFDHLSPLASWIGLSPGGSDDGLLTVVEAMDLRLAPGALVVLSACETARAEVAPGDELLGMRRAFIAAGSGTLLASHWPVGDEATRAFMEAWYQAWLRGSSPAAATLEARRVIASRFGAARDWTSWELTAAR